MKHYTHLEAVQRGTPDFPVAYYWSDYPVETLLHWHNDFEIIHIISGSRRVWINDTLSVLTQGDIAFINIGQLHRMAPDDCVYECVVLDLNLISTGMFKEYILPILNQISCVDTLLPEKDSELYLTTRQLFDTLRTQPEHYKITSLSLFYRLFALLYSKEKIQVSSENTQRRNQRFNTIIKLLNWLDEHYTEHITIDQLSKLVGINERYLCSLFKKFTNKTPIEYINEMRINHTANEILLNHRNITEAALESGFNDLSYFSRTFKKYKGISPSHYRNTLKLQQ